jgi:hypothetical protein
VVRVRTARDVVCQCLRWFLASDETSLSVDVCTSVGLFGGRGGKRGAAIFCRAERNCAVVSSEIIGQDHRVQVRVQSIVFPCRSGSGAELILKQTLWVRSEWIIVLFRMELILTDIPETRSEKKKRESIFF